MKWLNIIFFMLLIGCLSQTSIEGKTYKERVINGSMEIELPFGNMEYIDKKYTCEGEDVSPMIKIKNVPENAESLAVIVDDPDAPLGVFVHWVVWNIPVGDIEEGTTKGVKGRNDFGRLGYNGPCPPPGKPHRYFFKVYALDRMLDLPEGSTKEDLLNAMQHHIVGKAEVVGLYKR